METIEALLATYGDRVVVVVNSTIIIGNNGDITAINESPPIGGTPEKGFT